MNVYPTLPGLAWPISRTPIFSTLTQASVSGREVRATYMQYPLYEFTLSYNYLLASDLAQLKGFFLQQQGSLQGFWLDAGVTDDSVSNQLFGTGDGATKVFTLVHAVGPYTEPVAAVNGAPTIAIAGVNQASGWSLSGNQITFTVAPANGAALTWTGNYFYQVRFKEDTAQFDEFLHQLHQLKTVTLRSYR